MRYHLYLVACLYLSVLIIPAHAAPPNIILFYVDDLGWMDLSCQGSDFYETPNIDRLATQGMRYTQAYTPHPRCLPARYGIITGRFPARGGVPGGKGHLQPDDYTLAQALKEGGYHTCFVGKWHLTGPYGEKNLPQNKGFDIIIAAGAAGAPPTYFYPYRKKPIDKLPSGWDIGLTKDAIHGLEGGQEGEYLTDRLTQETIKYLESHHDQPFFLYLSHYGVHTPLEAPEHLVRKYENKLKTMNYTGSDYEPVGKTGKGVTKMHQDNAVYAAMIESVDQSLGQIMSTLDRLGLSDNTVIVLTADNGGLSNRGENKRPLATSNQPLRTGKGWLYEGGIREPFIVKWPGVVTPGKVNTADVVIGTDLFPTFLEMAGLPLKPQHHRDGQSIVSSLKGELYTRKPLFWHSPTSRPYSTGDTDSSAVRIGNFKLIEWYNAGLVELYNLADDMGEKRDLSQEMPEKTQEMLTVLHDWRREINAHAREQRWEK